MEKKLLLLVVLFLTSFFVFGEEKNITYDYPEFGFSVLTPGGFNLMAGYSVNDYTFRLVGMSLGKTYGFQGEWDFNWGKSNSYKNGPGFVLGYMDYSDDSGNVHVTTNGNGVRGMIIGGHYFWNWGWFYSSLGLAYTAINPNTSPPITLLFNIGANFRFLHPGD